MSDEKTEIKEEPKPNPKLEIWNAVFNTDPAHTKEFKRAGGFSGTAIKPLYLIHKATELWGSMGDAWGAREVERYIHDNTLYLKAEVWYPGKKQAIARVEHWGGDVLTKPDKNGELRPNDEAFKMASTDAIGKCLVQLGFSADVHLGLFDDSKYVEKQRQEHAKPVFANASLRNTYFANVIKSYDACETVEELNNVILLNKAKFEEMRGSGSEHDDLAVDELQKRYKMRLDVLKKQQQENGMIQSMQAGMPQDFNEIRSEQ